MTATFYPHMITALGYVVIPVLIVVPTLRRPPGPRPRSVAGRLRWLVAWVHSGAAPIAAVPRQAIYLFAWFIFACALDHALHDLVPFGWALGLALHEVLATWVTVGYLATIWRRFSSRQREALRQVLSTEEAKRRQWAEEVLTAIMGGEELHLEALVRGNAERPTEKSQP